MKLKLKRLSAIAQIPAYAHEGDAGMDLTSVEGRMLNPGIPQAVSIGWAMEIPIGTEAQIRSRSGLALNHGVIVANAPGTIDSGFRGEVKVILINLGSIPYYVSPGQRIAQMVLARYEVAEGIEETTLSDSLRGANGFGSTGK